MRVKEAAPTTMSIVDGRLFAGYRSRGSAGSQAQGERSLEDVRQSGSAKGKAAIKRVREEDERRCLEELKGLADGARYCTGR